jgi:hypothetical protein
LRCQEALASKDVSVSSSDGTVTMSHNEIASNRARHTRTIGFVDWVHPYLNKFTRQLEVALDLIACWLICFGSRGPGGRDR